MTIISCGADRNQPGNNTSSHGRFPFEHQAQFSHGFLRWHGRASHPSGVANTSRLAQRAQLFGTGCGPRRGCVVPAPVAPAGRLGIEVLIMEIHRRMGMRKGSESAEWKARLSSEPDVEERRKRKGNKKIRP